MRKKNLPMNIQFFAEGGEGDGGNADQNSGNNNQGNQQQAGGTTIDYDKIQSMLETATAKKENAVLKSYFEQQGLSEEEVKQAITDFKSTKQQQSTKQQTDNAAVQTQLTEAQKVAEQAQIELEATKQAIGLGIDLKSLPYVLKMANFSNAKDKDGKISQENIKAALTKVLEDVPALKTEQQANQGFQIGANGQQQNQSQQQAGQTKTTQKRWNRFA